MTDQLDHVIEHRRENVKSRSPNSVNQELKTERLAPGVYRTVNIFPNFLLIKTRYGDWKYVAEEPFSQIYGQSEKKKEVVRILEQLANRPSHFVGPEQKVEWKPN